MKLRHSPRQKHNNTNNKIVARNVISNICIPALGETKEEGIV